MARIDPRWLVLCCLGCGPDSPSLTTATPATTSTGSSESAGTSASPTTTSQASTTTGSSTTDAGATTDVPGPVCEPLPEAMSRTLKLDGKEAYEHTDGSFDRACTVAGSDLSGGTWMLALDCLDEADLPVAHTIEMELDPPLTAVPLVLGDSVRLRVLLFVPFWGELYLKLLDEQGGLLLAHMGAPWVPGQSPEGPDYPPPDFFAPLTVARVKGCEIECPREGQNFLGDPCCHQRSAVDFTVDDETVRVYDANIGVLDASSMFELRVDSARWDFVNCDPPSDSSGGWTELMAVRRP